jgi:type III secretion protein T
MAMGLINRSAQQLNVFFLAMPIKSAFALLMLVISCNFAFGDLRTYSMHFSEVSETMLSIFR